MTDPDATLSLLHEGVRRWIWEQGWEELREIQARSIPVLLDGKRDAIIAAATASGKTEAAFLPILSRLAALTEAGAAEGVAALYVSPLRALINDQFRRLEGLCERLELPVFRWHGDVGAGEKARARRARGGVILITPESVEALLTRRGGEARALFRPLAYIVVDELHAFLDQPRGRQLRSLLHRLERAAERPVARVGLSATLADLSAAAAFLRPADPSRVEILEARGKTLDLSLQLRGHVDPASRPGPGGDGPGAAEGAIADHLFRTLRGRKGLVFAGSRRNVELYSGALAERCDREGVPREFHAHHGSLGRDWREHAEAAMRDPARPASVVCTTTLELGIDVGAIEAVAQVGPGQTVAGMRQRLGRSGRRPGQPAVLRVYVAERALGDRPHPLDALRPETVQAVAMVELLLARWMEPPRPGELHLSTLMHQVLALVCQHGGVTPARAHAELVASGVFGEVGTGLFQRLLKRMGGPEVGLLEQAPDGTLLLGPEGERLTARHDFFAVFATPEEYAVVHAGRPLGTVPAEEAPAPDDLIVFAGCWWRVADVDPAAREVSVTPAATGKPPRFGGSRAPLGDEVVHRMRDLYAGVAEPGPYLDAGAAALLAEARGGFRRLRLDGSAVVEAEGGPLLFPWVGGRRLLALTLSLRREGVPATPLGGVAATVDGGSAADLRAALARIASAPDPDAAGLAALVGDKSLDKFDGYLDEGLARLNYASRMIDTRGLATLAAGLAG